MLGDIVNVVKLMYALYNVFYDETIQNINNVIKSGMKCGVVGVKLLQFIAMYDGFLSPKGKKHLSNVFDDCDVHEWKYTKAMYERDFKCKMAEDFDFTKSCIAPVGSGSIGQVYKLFHRKTNAYVAVKVKHPYIERKIKNHVYIISNMLKTVNMFKSFPFTVLIEEFIKNICTQLDFVEEAENTKRMRKNFEDDTHIIIPEVLYHSQNIIVMTYHDGVCFHELNIESQHHVAYDLYMFMLQSIMVDDFVHCDLHFGNWKVQVGDDPDDFKIIIFDCGIVGQTGDSALNTDVILSAIQSDYMKLAYSLIEDMSPLVMEKLEVIVDDVTHAEYEKSSDRLSDFIKRMLALEVKFNTKALRCAQGMLMYMNVGFFSSNKFNDLIGEENKKNIDVFLCYTHMLLQQGNKYAKLCNKLSSMIDDERYARFKSWLKTKYNCDDEDVFIAAISCMHMFDVDNTLMETMKQLNNLRIVLVT